MRLEDLFTSRRRQHDPLEALAAQIGELRRQTRHISRALSHNAGDVAGDFGDTISDWSHDAARQGAWLAGIASRKAVQGARAVQRDPVPVIAVIGTVALLASLLARRR
ncbi:hypothetical protein ASD83_02720 [Devosia sp. Root685]|uniref:hypothetical protein n=1 Tax=Devosia sp. Root685 TaxID=1736587 RepID=UPI0006F3ABC6|nr:hypothetical protein [Devosia sp. Root685]KRA99451.1 hypothetical protein ASD83_02720 [Devosia sp. Root685]